MAQENSPDKEKRQGRTKKSEKPYVEQIDELLLVHNKNDPKEGLGVVSKADEKGNYQTVTPEEKNENSFLKFDKNSSILENFIKNFWSQLKEPTHFRLIRMTFMIGSRSTGAPCFIASLNARDPAIWNAISEESTSW